VLHAGALPAQFRLGDAASSPIFPGSADATPLNGLIRTA
jgi:hypothetical protein